eukprot:6226756-Prymnesium_polylepis.1
MCAVVATKRNWSVGGHLLAQLFVARSRVLTSLQLGDVPPFSLVLCSQYHGGASGQRHLAQ